MPRFTSLLIGLICWGTSAAAQTDPAPLRFTETLDLGRVQLAVPMELYLSVASDTEIAVKVAGNLRALQRRIPELLSDVAQDDCNMRIAFQVDEGLPEGDAIRARGRVQIQRFLCNAAQDRDSRTRILNHITRFDILLRGGIRNNCLDAELAELALDPSGLVGGALNITGLTRRIETTVRTDVNDILNDEEACLDMPEALQLLDARIDSGGFRDFGNDTLGFVIKGAVDLRAANAISLLNLVYERGLLDQKACDCGVAKPETVE